MIYYNLEALIRHPIKLILWLVFSWQVHGLICLQVAQTKIIEFLCWSLLILDSNLSGMKLIQMHFYLY